MNPDFIMVARAQACEETLKEYIEREEEWGRYDCARMTARHLKNMGHKVSLSKFGAYKNPVGAARALRRQGFTNLEAVMDDMKFERIPPAMAVMGDVVSVACDHPLGAMAIQLDGQNFLHAWQGGFAISELTGIQVAWHVPCLRALKNIEVANG